MAAGLATAGSVTAQGGQTGTGGTEVMAGTRAGQPAAGTTAGQPTAGTAEINRWPPGHQSGA